MSDQLDCQHVVGVTTVHGCARLLYEEDGFFKIFEMYGGLEFFYCPMCGKKLKEVENGG